MESANDIFKKDKIIAFLTVISVAVLCIQHFWGIFADKSKLQVAYIPLMITLVTIAINEMGGSYIKNKKIVKVAVLGAVIIALSGMSVMVAGGYGIDIDKNKILTKGLYIFITFITFVLDLYEVEKMVIV